MFEPQPISEILSNASIRDGMTVTPEGKTCAKLVHGVKMRDLVLHTDARGVVCEMYDPRWGFHEAPMVFSYLLHGASRLGQRLGDAQDA